ncbi:ParA family protein, partial [Tropheryma whipplei]|uniref:ParA family protein n=1 Tax=Tropheryma whipplei TaxID=2039 RepID=UPI0009B897DB
MYVVSISSLKGGVGKTTVCLGLACSALHRGIKTLVVDCDPQADASTGLGVSLGSCSITDVLEKPRKVTDAICATSWAGAKTLDVLVGSPLSVNYDTPQLTVDQIWVLEEALSIVETEYDLVLIDCNPSLGALTRIAWAASDKIAIVTEPGLFAISAVDRALRAINDLRYGISPRLQPLGIIVNRVYPKVSEHQFRLRELKDMFGVLALSPYLPERSTLQQAQGACLPIHSWPNEHAEDFAKRFDQLLDKTLKGA